jgi:hypothetical protein
MILHFVVYTRPKATVIEEKQFPSYEDAVEFYHRVCSMGWKAYYTSACPLHEFDRQFAKKG